MPDSLRDLLRQRAAESGGPAAGLTEGSLRKARGIARRRFAAVAVGAAAGLAIAGMAAGALILPDEPAPPADDPTSVPTDEPDEESTTATEEAADCGRPSEDWEGWGDSDTMRSLTELPDAMYVMFDWDGGPLTQVWRYEEDGSDFVIEHEIGNPIPAPDGNRHFIAWGCGSWMATADGSEERIEGLGVDLQFCDPVWSPDSNSVVLTVPSPEYDERYLLDVATGEQTELPEEISCQPRWSGDGEYLVSGDGTVAMRPDGTGRTELTAPSTEESELARLSSVSADLGRACFQIYEGEAAASGHYNPVRCDRYVDTETGADLELPIETERAQVMFLPDGGMLVSDHAGGDVEVSLFDAEERLVDSRVLDDRDASSAILTGYSTG